MIFTKAGFVTVECDDPILVRFMDPPSQILTGQAAIDLCRQIMDHKADEQFTVRQIGLKLAKLLMEDAPPVRVEQVKRAST